EMGKRRRREATRPAQTPLIVRSAARLLRNADRQADYPKHEPRRVTQAHGWQIRGRNRAPSADSFHGPRFVSWPREGGEMKRINSLSRHTLRQSRAFHFIRFTSKDTFHHVGRRG